MYTHKSVSLASGLTSSNFDSCVTELVEGMVNIVHAEERTRPNFDEMIQTTVRLLDEYNITFECRSGVT
jgi:hypothetical protein